MQLGQPSISSNPLPTYSTHAVPSPAGGIHSIDFVESEDRIHMLSWDDQRSEPIAFDDGYGDDGVHEVFSSQHIHSHVISAPGITPVWIPTLRPVTLPCYSVKTPFILTPHRGTVDTPEIQYVIRGGRVVRQQPPVPSRPIDPDTPRDETVREDDEIIKQLQSIHARISIWSLLASSTTHRETLIRALSRIRVDTTTSPEGLIHMLTAGRASCIVFSEDDLPLEGSDHTRPLHISVGCLGRRVPSVLLDNGSALKCMSTYHCNCSRI